MRRSTFALLTILAAAATGCVAPQAARSAMRASFAREMTPAPAASIDAAAPLRRSPRHSASIVKFVREHRAQLEYCRDLERATRPDFAGNATVEVTLEDNGYVLRARVRNRSWSADGASMEDCMLTAIRRWDFPDSGPLDEFVHAFSVTFGASEAEIKAVDAP
jgi:hypothetical protein